jgi:hypothetical protein
MRLCVWALWGALGWHCYWTCNQPINQSMILYVGVQLWGTVGWHRWWTCNQSIINNSLPPVLELNPSLMLCVSMRQHRCQEHSACIDTGPAINQSINQRYSVCMRQRSCEEHLAGTGTGPVPVHTIKQRNEAGYILWWQREMCPYRPTT